MKQRHFIDSHKGITFLAVLLMMACFDQWQNPTAWVYLALHGTYGILWIAKGQIFPDANGSKKTGWGYALVILGALILYWIPPFLLTWRGVHFWIPNMARKEKALARLDGFEEYKRKSKLFIPYIF